MPLVFFWFQYSTLISSVRIFAEAVHFTQYTAKAKTYNQFIWSGTFHLTTFLHHNEFSPLSQYALFNKFEYSGIRDVTSSLILISSNMLGLLEPTSGLKKTTNSELLVPAQLFFFRHKVK